MKTSHKEVQLAEVGPRFEMKRTSFYLYFVIPLSRIFIMASKNWRCAHPPPSSFFFSLLSLAYEIRQGTIEQDEADREWVLAHYTRTAKKRRMMWTLLPQVKKSFFWAELTLSYLCFFSNSKKEKKNSLSFFRRNKNYRSISSSPRAYILIKTLIFLIPYFIHSGLGIWLIW